MIDLKNIFKLGKPSVGSWLQIPSRESAYVLANQGFDWLTIDAEHALFDLQNIAAVIDVIHSKNCNALIRLPECDSIWIRRTLDAGADGIIVPMVNSLEIAMKAVEYCKYPPLGKRGFGFSHANNYGGNFNDYVHKANDSIVLIVQIEHVDGVRNVESILSLEEIDGVIIGPYDLAGSMGFVGQPNHLEVKRACSEVLECCLKYNKVPGIHIVSTDVNQVAEVIKQGYKFIAYGIDTLFLVESGHKLKKLKKDWKNFFD